MTLLLEHHSLQQTDIHTLRTRPTVHTQEAQITAPQPPFESRQQESDTAVKFSFYSAHQEGLHECKISDTTEDGNRGHPDILLSGLRYPNPPADSWQIGLVPVI